MLVLVTHSSVVAIATHVHRIHCKIAYFFVWYMKKEHGGPRVLFYLGQTTVNKKILLCHDFLKYNERVLRYNTACKI
jgi:hypothetical protein